MFCSTLLVGTSLTTWLKLTPPLSGPGRETLKPLREYRLEPYAFIDFLWNDLMSLFHPPAAWRANIGLMNRGSKHFYPSYTVKALKLLSYDVELMHILWRVVIVCVGAALPLVVMLCTAIRMLVTRNIFVLLISVAREINLRYIIKNPTSEQLCSKIIKNITEVHNKTSESSHLIVNAINQIYMWS